MLNSIIKECFDVLHGAPVGVVQPLNEEEWNMFPKRQSASISRSQLFDVLIDLLTVTEMKDRQLTLIRVGCLVSGNSLLPLLEV